MWIPGPKQLLISLLVATAFTTASYSLVPSATEANVPSGDASCDGDVNSIDAALILQLNANLLGSIPCGEAADVNGDGASNSVDAALVLQFSAGLLGSLGPPTGISTTLNEWSIVLPSYELAAGASNFNVTNEGVILHNVIFVRTDLAPDALPVDDTILVVDETAVDVIARSADLVTGETDKVAVELSAGSYVLVCNIPTHYDLGMFVGITVE